MDPQAAASDGNKQRATTDDVTLSQCIELFTQPETLSKEEAW